MTRSANSIQCGVNDFTFTDLTRPTHDRLVKIFSYLINFVRFRESQTPMIDEHFNKTEKTKTRIDTLYADSPSGIPTARNVRFSKGGRSTREAD